MKIKHLFIMLVILICTTQITFAQTTILGNGRVPGAFLGWDNSGTVGPLDIRNDFAGQPINFFSGTPSVLRMTILDGVSGQVGIGIAAPVTKLHIFNAATSCFIRIQKTGSSVGGFMIGVDGPAAPNLQAELRQNENDDMLFFTGNPTVERVRIKGTNTANKGFVGINTQLIPPVARLDVLQNVGTAAEQIGINVLNTDNSSATGSSIGIKSRATGSIGGSPGFCQSIAGWFEAALSAGLSQAAFVVPQNGGKVSIGFAAPFPNPTCFVPTAAGLLEVNGDIFASNDLVTTLNTYPSDAQLKTDTASYTNGLNVIRSIHPFTYKYNGKGGLPTDRRHVGVIAEDILNIPAISALTIDTFQLRLNPTDAQLTDILTVSQDAFLFTSINAIKQLDSSVTTMSQQIAQIQNCIDNLPPGFGCASGPNVKTQPGTQSETAMEKLKLTLPSTPPLG